MIYEAMYVDNLELCVKFVGDSRLRGRVRGVAGRNERRHRGGARRQSELLLV